MKKIYCYILAFFSLNISSCSFLRCQVTAEIFIKPYQSPFNEESFVHVLDNNEVRKKQPNLVNHAEWEIVRIRSVPVVQLLIDKLKLENAKGHPLKATEFKKNLRTKYKEKDRILYLSYKNSNSILAEEIINTLLEIYIEESIASALPSFIVFPKLSLQEKNQETKLPNKQEQDKIIATYWKEIAEMNNNIPQPFNLNKYQSHSIKIMKMADSSCSEN